MTAIRRRRSRDTRTLPKFSAGEVEMPWTVNAFDEVVAHDTSWLAHSHPTHELLWNENGASSVTIENRTWVVTPNVGVWIPAGLLHSASAPAGTWYRATHFDVRRVSPLAGAATAVEISPLLRLLLIRLADDDLPAGSREIAESMVLDVLEPSAHELVVALPQSPLLRPIVRRLQREPSDRRLLEDWARELGVSPRTITRAFTEETGLSFARWVASVRASHAIRLLLAGADSEDVAARVGFSTTSAFGAAFKKSTGLTPGSFRPDRSET